MIMYHGTTSDVQKQILSQGLIVNSPDRVWDQDANTGFHQSSRESLEGIYVTRNLMTAISSAGNAIRRRGGRVHVDADPIIVVTTLSKGLLGTQDEDRVTSYAKRMPSPQSGRVGADQHEYTAMHLYAAWLRISHNDWEDIEDQYRDHHRQELTQEWNDWQKAYADEHTVHFAQGGHEVYARILYELFMDNFIVTLKRLVSHLSLDSVGGYGNDYKVLKKYGLPNKANSENEYLQFMDKLTRTLKTDQNEDDYMANYRVTQDIGFNKRNKIVCVVRTVGVEDREKGDPYELVKVLYGDPPQDFITQYKERVGELVYWEDWKRSGA